MKKLLAVLATVPLMALAVDLTPFETVFRPTNNVINRVTNDFQVSGEVVAMVFYASTNSTGTVSTVSGLGASKRDSRTILGPIDLGVGLTVTNLPLGLFLASEKLIFSTLSPTSFYVSVTSGVQVIRKE